MSDNRHFDKLADFLASQALAADCLTRMIKIFAQTERDDERFRILDGIHSHARRLQNDLTDVAQQAHHFAAEWREFLNNPEDRHDNN